MAAIVPYRFLVRVAHPCPYVKNLFVESKTAILEMPDVPPIRNYAELDGRSTFATIRLAWNDFGLGLQVDVIGKDKDPVCDADRPRSSDGCSFWLDTRDARSSHRASRYCHQFHLMPSGGGPDKDEPVVKQSKINRAQQDAPLIDTIPFRCQRVKKGYRIQAFFSATALTGFDPEQHPRLGFMYHVRDEELGDDYLSVNNEFPFSDDPSLWEVLELIR